MKAMYKDIYLHVYHFFQAKLKRRLVLGLREVTKHLKLKKIKCVIISPNLEKIQSKGKNCGEVHQYNCK